MAARRGKAATPAARRKAGAAGGAARGSQASRAARAGAPSAPRIVLLTPAGPAVAKALRKADAEVLVGTGSLPAPLAAEVARQHARAAVAVVPTLGQLPGAAPLLVVVKPPAARDALTLARCFGAAMRALLRERVGRAVLRIPAELADAGTAAPTILGIARGLYRFDRYKSSVPAPLPEVAVAAPDAAWLGAARRAIGVAEGTWLARDLVNTPAEDMGPAALEAVARDVARAAGLRVRVLDAAACAKRGLGALLAVGRAATEPARLVVLEHRGAPRDRAVLAFAGKGICFDTGGLDLKPASGMALMKKDMGGAATLLGVAWAVGRLRPRRNLRFYLAIAENAVGGNAIRPGDIVRALDGTTIEIDNTDAEGRVVLADAVALAVAEGATRIVDCATLTGAALIALGRLRVPLMATDDDLAHAIEAAAAGAGERVWRMPHDAEYRDALRSKVADLKNTGKGGEAGVIAAGLFIAHFARGVPWAHLDISPASWADGENDLGPEGATGTMVATLAKLALD